MSNSADQAFVLKAINLNSPVPYYAQVKEVLKESIGHGQLKPGNQLPGETDLCAIFSVSRTVIRQALDELEYEGLISRRKGKGTFVAEPKIVEGLAQKLTGFFQDMSERGYPPTSRILKQVQAPALPRVAGYLGLPPGQTVVEIERLRFVQNEPLVLVTTYLPYPLCKELLDLDLSNQSLYALLEQRLGLVIARGHRFLEAVAASPYEAGFLQVEVGAPLMLLDSVSYLEDGTPLEYYHALHRGDRSRFEAELIRVREPRV
jgi:GntR family transcriptional regulator